MRTLPRVSLNLKAGLAVAIVAVILVTAVSLAIGETNRYVVYRERIDLQDDSARTAFEIREDLRHLHADALHLAAETAALPIEAQAAFARNLAECRLDSRRSVYLEIGRVGPTKDDEFGSQTVLESQIFGETPFAKFAPEDAARLAEAKPSEVVTFRPTTMQVNGRPAAGEPDRTGPHYVICSLSPIAESTEYVYILMSLTPRLDMLNQDPRHLVFLTDGAGRWLVHPTRGMLIDSGPSDAAIESTTGEPGTRTFEGITDAALMSRAIDALRQGGESELRTRRYGTLLDGELETLTLRDDLELYYQQSKSLDPDWVRQVTSNGDYPLEPLLAEPGDRPTVKVNKLTRDIPRIRLLARSKDDLEQARESLEMSLGTDIQWENKAVLRDFMFHTNAIRYDTAGAIDAASTGDADSLADGRYLGLVQGISVQEVEGEVADALNWLRWMLFGALLFLGFVFWAANDVTRRLDRLSHAAKSLSDVRPVRTQDRAEADPQVAADPSLTADGWVDRMTEFEEALTTKRRDEVGILSNAFAGLLRQIGEAHAGLETQVHDLTENAVRERDEADAARDEAEGAKRVLTAFVARVNHEIRNPLTVVTGFADELWHHGGVEGDGTPKDAPRKIRSAAALIELQVDDLDVVTRVESDGLQPDFKIDVKTLDLQTLIASTCELMENRAAKRRNRLEFELDPRIERGEITFVSDERRCRQILMNLVSNSCKFTANGRIVVRAQIVGRRDCDMLQIEVEDTGRGMTADQKDKLFTPYQRMSDRDVNESGTGLGLCICRHLAGRLGGSLSLRWSETGRGSCFTMQLPLDGPPDAGDYAGDYAGDNGHFEGFPDAAVADSPPLASTFPGAGQAVNGAARGGRVVLGEHDDLPSLGHGRRVLVVDDDAEIRELISDHLTRRGFQVATAATGEAALRLARSWQPAVMTLDVLLPGSRLNGWDVLAQLKSSDETSSIPVVMITFLEDRTRGYALGAADFMPKPIDADRLSATLATLATPGRPGLALVVDDDEEQRAAIVDRLRRDGWEIDEASDGLDGLSAARRKRPDVILLDLAMPKMDGFQMIDRLGREPRLRDVPVIVLTGRMLSPHDLSRLNRSVQSILHKGSDGIERILNEVERHAAAGPSPQAAALAGDRA